MVLVCLRKIEQGVKEGDASLSIYSRGYQHISIRWTDRFLHRTQISVE